MEKQLVTFLIANEEYGIDILKVKEIIRLQEIVEIPESSNYVKGIIDLRGEIIPIIDLRVKFGLTSIEKNENMKIIIVELEEENLIGIIVDSVSQVIRIEEDDIESPPPTLPEDTLKYITGIAKYNNKIIIILKIEKILSTEEIIELKNISKNI